MGIYQNGISEKISEQRWLIGDFTTNKNEFEMIEKDEKCTFKAPRGEK